MVSERDVLEFVPKGLWIGSGPVQATGGGTFDVRNPADGTVIAQVADATPEDAMRALDAAVAAGAAWAATPARERGEILRAVFEQLTARAEEFALLMTLEMGKALSESRNEVRYGAEFFRWNSEEAVRIHGRYLNAPSGTGRIMVAKQPVGPCLAITPWNFPLAMGTRKIGPALAAGCTMIVKPASATPLTMLALAKLCSEAGLPDGVLSVVTTQRSGAVTGPLIDDPRLRKLTFTGSTEVGKKLVAASANRLLRTSMELGGNAPFVVFDDADIDAAVAGAMQAKLRNGGEACTAANRFYVQRGVVAEFTEKFVAKVRTLKTGDPAEDGTHIGPLINSSQVESVMAAVQQA
ncbi:aldehyde dehydrogenase family protein, partial [Streptomyces sp. NPDC058664]|uniref:aldehyde dehydrogenase family protein n=1 Tax=Streptomyces sp. NPDC058664 TaxID=3346585 RepID=UPI00364768C1